LQAYLERFARKLRA